MIFYPHYSPRLVLIDRSHCLTGLFSHLNNIGCIPVRWEVVIIVPLHKKEGKSEPNNCRLIRLSPESSLNFSENVTYLIMKLRN